MLSNKNARYTYIPYMYYLLVVYVHVQHPGMVFRKTNRKTVCKFPWQILPRKTTCPLKIHGWNMIHFLLSGSLFMFDIRSLSVGVCGGKTFPETTRVGNSSSSYCAGNGCRRYVCSVATGDHPVVKGQGHLFMGIQVGTLQIIP